MSNDSLEDDLDKFLLLSSLLSCSLVISEPSDWFCSILTADSVFTWGLEGLIKESLDSSFGSLLSYIDYIFMSYFFSSFFSWFFRLVADCQVNILVNFSLILFVVGEKFEKKLLLFSLFLYSLSFTPAAVVWASIELFGEGNFILDFSTDNSWSFFWGCVALNGDSVVSSVY